MITAAQLLPAENTDELGRFIEGLHELTDATLSSPRFNTLAGFLAAVNQAPIQSPSQINLMNGVIVGKESDLSRGQNQQLLTALHGLMPWRKGPFELFGLTIDTEWRSDWKWERLSPHIGDLRHKTILDVGCGNGYFMWRMLGAGAKRVIGIDPSPLFLAQFLMFQQYINNNRASLLPLPLEALPEKMEAFDLTLSMGVFYHRRSPMDHLRELFYSLRAGGTLVLETLIIEGRLGEVLVPPGRYAQMRNVWFIPSIDTLIAWLEKCGFKNVRCVDINQTSTEEQRATLWMNYHSLANFLDAENPQLTVEGHPAPIRAILLAEK